MGQQSNKVQKRRRRLNYLKRKKVASKTTPAPASATKAVPAKKSASKAAAEKAAPKAAPAASTPAAAPAQG